jgi:hypothetical protein
MIGNGWSSSAHWRRRRVATTDLRPTDLRPVVRPRTARPVPVGTIEAGAAPASIARARCRGRIRSAVWTTTAPSFRRACRRPRARTRVDAAVRPGVPDPSKARSASRTTSVPCSPSSARIPCACTPRIRVVVPSRRAWRHARRTRALQTRCVDPIVSASPRRATRATPARRAAAARSARPGPTITAAS